MMGAINVSDDFNRDAVAQITGRGYPVKRVSDRLGVSLHSLYAWKRKLAKAASGDAEKDAETLRVKRELVRVPEERAISSQAIADFASDAKRDTRSRLSIESSFPFGRSGAACDSRRAGPMPGLQKSLSRRARDDRRQIRMLHKAWTESGKVCGYRKLHDDRLERGESICPNRVAGLAQLAGIKAQIGYKRRPRSYGNKPSVMVDNALDWHFAVENPAASLGELVLSINK